jgi:hypothetical protein
MENRENKEPLSLDISEDEIIENFRLLTSRPVTTRTVSVGKCIAKVAQWHVIEILKLGLMPLRVGNYYLIKAEVVEDLFQKLDKNSIEQAEKKPLDTSKT